MRQIALPKFFFINVIIDIYSLFSHIAPKLLDEFAGHTSAPKVSCEPMAAAMSNGVGKDLLSSNHEVLSTL